MSPSLRRPNDEISDVKAYLGIPQHGREGGREGACDAGVHTFGVVRRDRVTLQDETEIS